MKKCEIIFQNVGMIELLEKYGIYPSSNNRYLCPFHDDHHPSATVDKNRWFHCWVCNENLNVINFVKKKENCDTRTAIEILNEMFNLGLNEKMSREKQEAFRRQELKILREKKRKLWWEYFTNDKRREIVSWLRYWQTIEDLTHPTRGEVRNGTWQYADLFFIAVRQRMCLEWLYWKICGREISVCELDYIFGYTRLEVLRNLYNGKIVLSDIFGGRRDKTL